MESFDAFASPFWLTTGIAILCGAIVGLERQLRGKPVGVRTSCLISLGTAVFVQVGRSVASGGGDPTRVLGQVVTGVGFLGAGVMLAREGVVTGVTTASVIWVLAAVGAAAGFGYLTEAVALALMTVAILTGVDLLETRVRALTRGVHSRIAGKGTE